MTASTDFTSEEWATLQRAPSDAGSYVVTAEPSIFGMLIEIRALARALEKTPAPDAARELVAALVADLADKDQPTVERAQTEGESVRQQLYQGLQTAGALVDAKCSPEEAKGFKQWLVSLAEVAANAHKEGGVLGIGGVRVSDREQAALGEIRTALGL